MWCCISVLFLQWGPTETTNHERLLETPIVFSSISPSHNLETPLCLKFQKQHDCTCKPKKGNHSLAGCSYAFNSTSIIHVLIPKQCNKQRQWKSHVRYLPRHVSSFGDTFFLTFDKVVVTIFHQMKSSHIPNSTSYQGHFQPVQAAKDHAWLLGLRFLLSLLATVSAGCQHPYDFCKKTENDPMLQWKMRSFCHFRCEIEAQQCSAMYLFVRWLFVSVVSIRVYNFIYEVEVKDKGTKYPSQKKWHDRRTKSIWCRTFPFDVAQSCAVLSIF